MHEAVEEWNRWRIGSPMYYESVAAMPFLTMMGFEYLCSIYGKSDLNPLGASSHMTLLEKEIAKVYHNMGAEVLDPLGFEVRVKR